MLQRRAFGGWLGRRSRGWSRRCLGSCLGWAAAGGAALGQQGKGGVIWAQLCDQGEFPVHAHVLHIQGHRQILSEMPGSSWRNRGKFQGGGLPLRRPASAEVAVESMVPASHKNALIPAIPGSF